MILTNFFNTFFGNTFKSYAASAEDATITDHQLSWASSFGGISSCITRLCLGCLLDYFDFKSLYFGLLTVQLANIIVSYNCVGSTPIYFGCILVNNACTGASFTCLPVSIGNVFGLKYGTTVYSIVLTGSLVSSLLNVLNAQLVLAPYGFFESYTIRLTATLVAFAILWQFEEKLDVERVFKLSNK